jgi:hypothetical protein
VAARTATELNGWLDQYEDDSCLSSQSAEDATCSGTLGLQWLLDDAVERGVIPGHAVAPIMMILHGWTIDEAAKRTHHSRASMARYRDRFHTYVRNLGAAA